MIGMLVLFHTKLVCDLCTAYLCASHKTIHPASHYSTKSNARLDEIKKTHTVLAIRNLIFVTVIGIFVKHSTVPTWIVQYSLGYSTIFVPGAWPGL